MARKNEYGRIILSAGEIGSYTVCPEAWRLRSLKKVLADPEDSAKEGQKLHDEWVTKFDESAYLHHRIRFVVGLLLAAALIYTLSNLR